MKYALINGHILNGTENMKVMDGYTVLINDDKIEDIVKDDISFSGYKIIDLNGQYLLPGLINLHVHLAGSGRPKKRASDPVKLVKLLTSNALLRKLTLTVCKNFAKTELMSGVTTIRTVGGVTNVDTQIRDKINEGKWVGPRILAANMAISVPNGHMVNSIAYPAKDPEDAKKLVRKIALDRPDLIKLMITGGVLDAKVKGEPGVLKMPPEIVKAACDEAHRLGYVVAAHVESPESVKVALENGVDTIEHGAQPSDEIIDLFKERKACDICTISPALPFALFDRNISGATELEQFNGNVIFEGGLECVKTCLKNNIPVGLGTDTSCPYITHYDMWREINYYHKYCGVTPEFALYSATLGNAKIAKLDKITGSIEKGKCADMIVCKENPLKDFTTLRKLSYVIAKGNVIKNPKVKKIKEIEQELDKFI